ncbi:Arc family DNA-binding protein [Thioclava electrotropha]|uniref:Arc family DNA-binding protein n=1 Tax=Thioclava electrotropha TaxID=1549850 RepID=UPI0018E1A831|nr:Arc family DNA-binding protein [Thioclava electrotropha]
MAEYPSDKQDKFMLRLPDGLKDRIKAKADEHGRSMNAEIVQLLENEYPAPTDVLHLHVDDIRKLLDIYEKETDPKRRLYLQLVISDLVTAGNDFQIVFDEDGNF